MEKSNQIRFRLVWAVIALLIALFASLAATFAWYIYNTNAHTTTVHMAAGASASLEIANSFDGPYGSSAVLDEFVGTLNPVSTNRISGGFQKVFGFTNGSENQPTLVANLFGSAETADFYKSSLYLRSTGGAIKIYLSDIGFDDSSAEAPISTAIRVGLVFHSPGRDQPAVSEYIFEINAARNPEAEYNTAHGEDGNVLDCTKTDGTTVPFTPLGQDNFCNYNVDTGMVTLKERSTMLCELPGNGGGAVQVDVYIWLEGCDGDCTNNLCSTTLKNLALSFSGYGI